MHDPSSESPDLAPLTFVYPAPLVPSLALSFWPLRHVTLLRSRVARPAPVVPSVHDPSPESPDIALPTVAGPAWMGPGCMLISGRCSARARLRPSVVVEGLRAAPAAPNRARAGRAPRGWAGEWKLEVGTGGRTPNLRQLK
ncbi:hypothetical protein B0H15DRAFT_956313 [Mycena belliarum]|uniref:Uncharacterized protein n=1 Tax=Mycena belliarum TaxID=1033014 RepID=A0AAD6TUN7_9AGAR|nr:hypothetical protein B0H15DRAFT_956313 [Mycena belliae]